MESKEAVNTTKKSAQRKPISPMPSHADQLANLNRIEGQVRGIARMVEENRYCLDILNQCRSVHAALESVEKKIFRRFLDTCVREKFKNSTNGDLAPLLDELVGLLERR